MSLDGYIADLSDGVGPLFAIEQAKAFAGDRDISVSAGNIAGQAFEAGLVDRVLVDLAPVVFGAGVRYFGDYTGSPFLLGDPEVIQGDRVTHLIFTVR